MELAMTASHFARCWSADLANAIGNTPLIWLRGASKAAGCTILGKAEFMNPGGPVNDRAGRAIVRYSLFRGRGETVHRANVGWEG
jgi:cysteine synthase A